MGAFLEKYQRLHNCNILQELQSELGQFLVCGDNMTFKTVESIDKDNNNGEGHMVLIR